MEYLVNYSMPTTTNYAILGEIICDMVQEPDWKLVRNRTAFVLLATLVCLPDLLLDGEEKSMPKQPSQLSHGVEDVNAVPNDNDSPMNSQRNQLDP